MIIIAIPIRKKNDINNQWLDWFNKLKLDWDADNISYKVIINEGMYYDESRNHLVELAKQNNATHILFIDDDIFMPMKGLQELLELKKDVIAFPAFAKQMPLKSNIFPNFYFTSLAKIPKNKIIKVDWVGTGCMLINMKIFQKLDKPYFGSGKEIEDKINDTTFTYRTSEDEYFCRKLKKEGLEVWVATSNVCEHYCKKQNIFFPSLSTINNKGVIVYGGFFDYWAK